jgi:alkylated DNA repair dioxygenase AlkB
MDSLIHIPNYVDNATEIFDILKKKIRWQKIPYFKRHISHYSYGMYNVDELYTFNTLLMKIQKEFDKRIVGVFMNYYENGNEYAPYHADKYKCDVCLISFGITRILRYKHNTRKENTDYILNNGDILYIPDEINKEYKHSLLKRTKINDSRISVLLFLK